MPFADMFALVLYCAIHWVSEYWGLLLMSVAAYALYVAAVYTINQYLERRQ